MVDVLRLLRHRPRRTLAAETHAARVCADFGHTPFRGVCVVCWLPVDPEPIESDTTGEPAPAGAEP